MQIIVLLYTYYHSQNKILFTVQYSKIIAAKCVFHFPLLGIVQYINASSRGAHGGCHCFSAPGDGVYLNCVQLCGLNCAQLYSSSYPGCGGACGLGGSGGCQQACGAQRGGGGCAWENSDWQQGHVRRGLTAAAATAAAAAGSHAVGGGDDIADGNAAAGDAYDNACGAAGVGGCRVYHSGSPHGASTHSPLQPPPPPPPCTAPGSREMEREGRGREGEKEGRGREEEKEGRGGGRGGTERGRGTA